jgi:DNA mismatch repair protein MutL
VRVSIRILPEDVASAIAAGEVIERPASVVKELLENSLDAGASQVWISLENGGRTSIEVADDGCGIPAGELPLAVARYATSKLETADDLFAIRSLGFRGEALASIGAVARMDIRSRVGEEEAGARITVEGGKISRVRAVGIPAGTTVRVQDLFFNLPARLKFLKSDLTERRRIEALVSRYALAYPSVRFRLEEDGRTALQSTGSGESREALAAVFGLDVAREMIALPQTEAGRIRVRGFVSPPSVQRSNRREMTFFVNGRWVQDQSLSTAVLQAYQGLLMVGRYPVAVILIDLPAEAVDVNVHPAKAEIRLREPEKVFSILQRAVRATLLGMAPAVESGPGWGWGAWPPLSEGRPIAPDWEAAHSDTLAGPTIGLQAPWPGAALPLLRAVGQIGAAYLVAEGPDGLYLVDQHAAHERVLFEGLMAERERGRPASQALLEAQTIHLAPGQAGLLEENLPTLEGLGFEVEAFGGGTFRLRATPAILAKLAPEAALRVVVEDFEEDEAPLEGEIVRRIAARVCKRAAVKSGQVLSLAEQEKLLRDLEGCASPRTCPHGRPTMIHLSVETLERQFGRKG